jgi:hypothetical protein
MTGARLHRRSGWCSDGGPPPSAGSLSWRMANDWPIRGRRRLGPRDCCGQSKRRGVDLGPIDWRGWTEISSFHDCGLADDSVSDILQITSR